MNTKLALIAFASTAVTLAHASEGFENVSQLFFTGDWDQVNMSNPVPPTNTDPWVQGDVNSFPAASGSANSYIAANYTATGVDPDNTGTISAWLFAPTRMWSNGDHVQFVTRTAGDSTFADRLQVRLSLSGTSTFVGASENSVGNFSNLLLDINSGLDSTGYPHDWTAYDAVISGLNAPTWGRIGFRYYVTDAGAFGTNSNIVGIDSYNIQAVPEPATLAMLGMGAAAMIRRRRAR